MHKTKLRRVAGSILLAVPPAILDLLHREAGSTVGLAVDGERLAIVKPHYTMDELLAASDYSRAETSEEREWIDAAPRGGEPL